VISDRDVGQPDALLIDRELTDVRQIKISPRCCDRRESEKCRSENKDAFKDTFHGDWVKQFDRNGSADKERLNICEWHSLGLHDSFSLIEPGFSGAPSTVQPRSTQLPSGQTD
jgi:hypothetical protein